MVSKWIPAISIVTAAVLGLTAVAQAAPDWTAPRAVGPPEWALSSLGFATDGTELAAHIDVLSQAPFDTKLVVSHRTAGGDFADEVTFNEQGGEPANATLAVAPNGAAVVAWYEYVDPANAQSSPVRYRAAYRAPDGTWSQPITLAAPWPAAAYPEVKAAVAPDGTGAAAAVVDEQSGWGELQADTNVMIAVHPAAGAWSQAQRVSPYDVSADGVELAFDDSAQLTATWRERYDEGATSSENDDRWKLVTRRRSASNGIWSNAEDLTSSAGSANAPVLGLAGDGRAVIAFQWKHVDSTIDAWASTRSGSDGTWTSPHRIATTYGNIPMAAGVGPDGMTYLLSWSQVGVSTDDNVNVVRMPPGGGWGTPKPLQKNDSFRDGAIAFIGSDPVFVWEALDNPSKQFLLDAARWRAGAADPDAPRQLEQPDAGNALQQAVSDHRGGVVAVWGQPSSRMAAFDGGAPDLTSSNVPTTAIAGESFDATVAFADMWSELGGAPTWDFGDGSAQVSGAGVKHVYAQPGSYTISVTAADTLGNKTTKNFPIQVSPATPAPATTTDPTASDAVKPTVRIATPRCRRGETKRACALRRKTRAAWQVIRGAVRDAAPSSGIAKVEVAITPLKKGRATAPARYRKATVKGTTWSRKAGRLKRGTYMIRVRAFDAAGNVSRVVARKIRLR